MIDDPSDPSAIPDIPVDRAPVGTPNDLDRSFQAAQAAVVSPAPASTPSSTLRIRPRMLVGQLLVLSGAVGGSVLYVQQSAAESVTPASNPPPSLMPWVIVAAMIVVGIALVVQAVRLRRAID